MVLELYYRKAGGKREGRKRERQAMAKRREGGREREKEILESEEGSNSPFYSGLCYLAVAR